MPTASGKPWPATDSLGCRTSRPAGCRIVTDPGPGRADTVGRGWAPSRGAGPLITTATGTTAAAALRGGHGFRRRMRPHRSGRLPWWGSLASTPGRSPIITVWVTTVTPLAATTVRPHNPAIPFPAPPMARALPPRPALEALALAALVVPGALMTM